MPKTCGQRGTRREWIFVQLGANWYARELKWKLNNAGELFDLSDTPFVEKLIAADTQDAGATAAGKRLQDMFDQLNPTAGKTMPHAKCGHLYGEGALTVFRNCGTIADPVSSRCGQPGGVLLDVTHAVMESRPRLGFSGLRQRPD